ncbi:MAG: efflux RND transporter periplasmic adaptor subunit [Anaerolineaceae bacterium]|nr:efflux RND transporter periplasmic adaptor subunit [Anaerolineaceae bacterium]
MLTSFNRSKILIVFLLLLMSFSMILTGCSENGLSIGKQEPTETPIPEVSESASSTVIRTTYEVKKGDIIRTIQFSGRMGPSMTMDAEFGESGRVGHVYFERGDMVEEGDVIATLDYLDDLEREQRLTEIAFRRTEISVERAQLLLDYARETSPNNTLEIALKEFDLELAQLSMEELQMSLDRQEESVDDAMLVAPMTGLITEMRISEGKDARALDSVITIADISKLSIVADTFTDLLEEMTEGMPVMIEISNAAGDPMPGVVRQMPYPYGTGMQQDNTRQSFIEFDDPSLYDQFSLGDRFFITAVVGEVDDVLVLPVEAIREFGGRTFVMVQDGDMQRSVDIKLGMANDELVQILEGLEEGQVVVGQ